MSRVVTWKLMLQISGIGATVFELEQMHEPLKKLHAKTRLVYLGITAHTYKMLLFADK